MELVLKIFLGEEQNPKFRIFGPGRAGIDMIIKKDRIIALS
jgi:hypothetical protein